MGTDLIDRKKEKWKEEENEFNDGYIKVLLIYYYIKNGKSQDIGKLKKAKVKVRQLRQ